MEALLSLLLAVNIQDLHHANYHVREATQAAIQSRLTYPTALMLEAWGGRSPESRARVRRLVNAYWYACLPAWSDLPFIDSLNRVRRCEAPNTPLVNSYLNAASLGVPVNHCNVSYPNFRFATWLLACDLIRYRVPKPFIRALLAEMGRRSAEWETRRRLMPAAYPHLDTEEPPR